MPTPSCSPACRYALHACAHELPLCHPAYVKLLSSQPLCPPCLRPVATRSAIMPFLPAPSCSPACCYALHTCVSVPVSQPLHDLSGPPGYRLHRLGPFTVPFLCPRSLSFRPRWLYLSSRGLQSGTPLTGLSFPRLRHPTNRRLSGTPVPSARAPSAHTAADGMPPAGPWQKDIWQFVARTFTLDNPLECSRTATDQIRAARRF